MRGTTLIPDREVVSIDKQFRESLEAAKQAVAALNVAFGSQRKITTYGVKADYEYVNEMCNELTEVFESLEQVAKRLQEAETILGIELTNRDIKEAT